MGTTTRGIGPHKKRILCYPVFIGRCYKKVVAVQYIGPVFVKKKEVVVMKYSDGYVAFIDILGFSNYVLDENNALKVSNLFSFVEKFCRFFNESPKHGVNVSFFSDSIILSAEKYNSLPVPIYIAESYLTKELGLLFRGGITKGKYYHSRGVTFGPGVISAYQLEKQAVYSRILIDDAVMKDAPKEIISFFCDTDGKWCLNPYEILAFEGTAYGSPDGPVYPQGDPGGKLLEYAEKSREKILEAIKTHMGTPVVEKYIWRTKPFNYTCERYAKHPQDIEMFQSLNYVASESFCKSMLNLRISNLDYET